jgi:hypothetical protein
MNTNKRKLVWLTSGERFEVLGESVRGVEIDAGTIPWEECMAFLCWSEAHNRWFSIPLQD